LENSKKFGEFSVILGKMFLLVLKLGALSLRIESVAGRAACEDSYTGAELQP